jgi:hypothetical protein
MRVAGLAAALLLAACQRQDAPAGADTPGDRLERAAVAAGLVADPARVSPIGAWAREGDRLCVAPGSAGMMRIGVLLDYGEGQGCAASGTVRRRGETLAVAFGACRFDARFDGERIVFPAELPAACDALCTGRATLSALSVEQISASASEAGQLRDTRGWALCGG